MRKKLPIAKTRPCGGCTACCTVLGVHELDKSPWTPCAHLATAGCGIYAERPSMCREFHCLWQGGAGEERDRPDRLGVMFAPTVGPTEFTGQIEVQAYELVPDAFSRPHVVEVAKRFVAKGRLVIGHVLGGESFRFLGPPEKVARARAWVAANNGMNPPR